MLEKACTVSPRRSSIASLRLFPFFLLTVLFLSPLLAHGQEVKINSRLSCVDGDLLEDGAPVETAHCFEITQQLHNRIHRLKTKYQRANPGTKRGARLKVKLRRHRKALRAVRKCTGGTCESLGKTPTTPPGTRPTLADLSVDEKLSLCEEANEYFVQIGGEEAICNIAAWSISVALPMDESQCDQVKANCHQVDSESACHLIDQHFPPCPALVEDYRACFRAASDEIVKLGELLNCSRAGDPKALQEWEGAYENSDLPACASLARQCPELIENPDTRFLLSQQPSLGL